MRYFRTARERRLWIWIALVMVAIYSTLGPARDLADFLRERNLLRASSIVLAGLIVVLVAWSWLRTRPESREIGIMLGVGFVYLWTFARMTSPEERTHLIEYGVIAALVHQALQERERGGGQVPVPALGAIAVTVALGWIDEGIQSLLPGRTYDLRDVGFNTLAALAVVSTRVALEKVRGPQAGDVATDRDV